MFGTALSWLTASFLTLGLAACGTDRIDDKYGLFQNPGPATRLTPGLTSRTDVDRILGAPFAEWRGAINARGKFEGTTFGVMPSGSPATQLEYHAHRYQAFGDWPLERHRLLSRHLTIVVDANGLVREVTPREDIGAWDSKGLFSKGFF